MAQCYRSHLVDDEGAEATFQPKWSVLITVKCSDKNKATDARTNFPAHPSPTMVGELVEAATTSQTLRPGWWLLVVGKQHWEHRGQELHHLPHPPWEVVP